MKSGIKPQKFTATVVKNEYIAKETRKTIFRIEDSFDITFHAGQFFNLFVEDKVMRAYSIASSPNRLPEFELCVKVVENGKGSGYIDDMKEGETVSFMGPFGHFGLLPSHKKTIMIATGTGIAPMKAICDEMAEKGFENPTQLIFGVREKEYASYNDVFASLGEKFENFDYQLYVSRPKEDFIGNEGRVTNWLLGTKTEDFIDTQILVCGNPAMVKEVKKILQEEKNVSKENIVVEAF